MKINLLLLIAALLCLNPPLSAADSSKATDYQNKLDNIREKITRVLNSLNESENKRDSVRTELKKLELRIAKIAKNLRQTRYRLKKTRKRLKNLENDVQSLNRKISQQRNLLAEQLRAAYKMGRQPQLKMLLNQQNPTEMGRALVYFDWLNRARVDEIQDYLANLAEKERLQANIHQAATELQQLLAQQKQQKSALSADRASRKKLLARLDHDIQSQQATLEDLNSSRSRIEELLLSLGELLADIPAEPATQKPFASLKGHLPWPVRGTLVAHFGARQKQGDLKWNGVILKTAYGTPVRAVSNGRVAFADWLQGYGFITIIDHGDGYMSLYGHNQALYKQAGDWVEAGEVIATVGDSGGQAYSGLYFEIRYQGKPVNPTKWCSSSVRHASLSYND